MLTATLGMPEQLRAAIEADLPNVHADLVEAGWRQSPGYRRARNFLSAGTGKNARVRSLTAGYALDLIYQHVDRKVAAA